jgi:nitroreductase
MAALLDLLSRRRSIREYQKVKVEKSLIDTMLRSVLFSPTSKGIASRSIIVVDDPDILASLAECKAHGAGFLSGAPLAFVVAADTEKAAAWIEDASIAAITLQYSAEELGLSSCWIQVRGRKRKDGTEASAYIKELLSLPPQLAVEAVVAVGYPGESLSPHGENELDKESIRLNGYEKPYTLD